MDRTSPGLGREMTEEPKDTLSSEQVAEDELQLETLEDLDRFFAAIDAQVGTDPEPDWVDHKRVIEASRREETS